MTFSSQSSDSCFETAVNSLGKLSVSNTYSPKSKVVVSPAVCYVGEHIQFKIQLFSSTGNLIVDEDVNVCLKLNGKSFEFINCAFDIPFSSFTGLWVPDMELKIFWVVVSNDIELRTLHGVINNRKRRTFTKTEKTCEILQLTEEGLKIKIYLGSITCLDVDCIVNAALENLMHGGGVAVAISEATGYEFDQESMDYIQKYGHITVGTCCVTSAGKLPYKCLIHTVGPRWSEHLDKNQCLKLLQVPSDAIKMGMKSIAIPAISSGRFPSCFCSYIVKYYSASSGYNKPEAYDIFTLFPSSMTINIQISCLQLTKCKCRYVL